MGIRQFDATAAGALVSRIMTDAEGVRNLVATGVVELVGGLVTAVVAVAVLVYLDWRLTLAIVIVLGAFGGAMAFAFTRLRPLAAERASATPEVTGRLTERLGGIRTVTAYTAEAREHRVFADGVDRLFDAMRRSMRAASATTSMGTIVIGLIAVVVIALGGRAIAAGTMTAGDFVMYVLFVALLHTPVVQMASIVTQLTAAFAGLDRIAGIRGLPTEDELDRTRVPLPRVAGEIVFERVGFSYVSGHPLLRSISLVTPAGSTTALVGPSRSGKSTLIGLVLAFHSPESGRILVDGHDVETVRLADYRGALGAVLQDNFLFDGTVADNIRFSSPDAGLDEVLRAGRIAHCDEFIERLPHGYDTVAGERGVRLSGGQRQRVAIARAILGDPRILALDEATSSLDSASESVIQDALRALRRGRTTFVIAHRLSTIRSADQILVLDRGEIVERGTHDELMGAGGLYRRLHQRQHRIERDRFVNPGEEPPAVEATPDGHDPAGQAAGIA